MTSTELCINMKEIKFNLKITTQTIVESIGIIGIMGSLIFVGVEVSQNSSIARTESYQSYISGFTDLYLAQINNNELNALMVKASTGVSTKDLTLEENRKIRLFYISLLRQWEGVYRSVDEDILPEEMLTMVGAGHLLGHTIFKEIWPDISLLFTNDFSDFVDSVDTDI